MLDSITYSDKLFNMPITTFLACIGAALALGIGTALIFQFKTKHTASMAITLAIMPPAIALVIMLVNGNIGAGVAVAGAFALGSRPAKRTSPASGCTKPSRLLSVVVFPAPLRPMKPVIVPGASAKFTSFSSNPS